jgi:hypothetical protein
MKKPLISIILAGIWISFFEFLRNEILFNHYWVDHYAAMGLDFPAEPINGAIWGIWSMLFAVGIYVIRTRFSFIQATLLAWFMGFVLMWLVVGNMAALPFGILPYAIPLSLLEVIVAVWIIQKISSTESQSNN